MNATRYDLVLGGIVRVRLQGASPRVAAALARQLGAPAPERAGDAAPRPDIEVTVAEPGRPMPVEGVVDDDASPLRVVIADLGPGRPIPQLRSLTLLVAIALGWAPVHATAVRHEDRILAIAGGRGAGKSGVQLELVEHGGTLLAAEWLLLRPGSVVPLRHPVRLRASHLAAYPRLVGVLDLPDAARLGPAVAFLRGVDATVRPAPAWLRRPLRDAARRAARGVTADVEPGRFGPPAITSTVTTAADALDTLAILVSDADGTDEMRPREAVPLLAELLAADLDGLTEVVPGWAAVHGPSGIATGWRERYEGLLTASLGGVRCVRIPRTDDLLPLDGGVVPWILG